MRQSAPRVHDHVPSAAIGGVMYVVHLCTSWPRSSASLIRSMLGILCRKGAGVAKVLEVVFPQAFLGAKIT